MTIENRRFRWLFRYGTAFLAAAPAVAITSSIPVLHRIPFALPTVTVSIVAWFLGFGPAILTTLVALIATNYLLFAPGGDFALDPGSLAQNLVLAGMAVLIAFLTEANRISQRARQRSEASYSTTLSSIGDAVIATDRVGRITFVNPVASSLTGWSFSEAKGRHLDEVFQIIDEGTREKVESPIEKVRTLGSVAGLTDHTLLISRSGDEISIDDSGAPIFDRDGKLIGVVLVFRDIRTKRAAERDRESLLRRTLQAELEVRATLESIADGFFALDSDWRFAYVTNEGERLMKATKPELLGRSYWEVYPDTRGSVVESSFRRCVAEQVPVSCEYFYPRWGQWFEVRAYPGKQGGLVVYFRDITQQKLGDEALRINTERLALAQQSANAAAWEFDPATGSLVWSLGSPEVFGRPFAAVSNMEALMQIVDERDHPVVIKAVSEKLEPGQTVRLEYRARYPNGDLHWLEVRGNVTNRPSGELVVRGITMDITARKQAEAALHESEERHRFLTESLPIYIWMGEAGKMEFCNRQVLEFTGLTLEEIRAGKTAELVHPHDRLRFQQATREAVQTGEPLTIEYRIRRADGLYRWHFAHSRRFIDGAGREKWLGTAVDLTDRKVAEEELRSANERLSLALATARMGDWEWDLRGGLIHWSGAVRAMHSGARFDGTLVSWLDLVHPDDRGKLRDALAQVRSGAGPGEVEYRTREGMSWILMRFVLTHDSDGTPERLVGISMDITARKQSEESIRRSEKLAAAGRLAASISHEINNPLESVTNLLFILQSSSDLPEPLRQYLEMAQTELARVSQIATQTLRFYRQSTRAVWTDIPGLLDSVLALFQGRLNSARVNVVRDYRETPAVFCHDGELRQVFVNLVGNALDAMAGEGGKLIVRVHPTNINGSGPGVRVLIADTGSGIPAEAMRHLFEPFFTTKPNTGTGLGLWVTRSIVQKHGGKIRFRTRNGPTAGTVFSVLIPTTALSEMDSTAAAQG